MPVWRPCSGKPHRAAATWAYRDLIGTYGLNADSHLRSRSNYCLAGGPKKICVRPDASSISSTDAPMCRASCWHRRIVSGSLVCTPEGFPSISFAAITTSGTLLSSICGRVTLISSLNFCASHKLATLMIASKSVIIASPKTKACVNRNRPPECDVEHKSAVSARVVPRLPTGSCR